jgi:hypothetical protein
MVYIVTKVHQNPTIEVAKLQTYCMGLEHK